MESVKFNPAQTAVLNAVKNMTIAFHAKDLEGVMKSYEPNATIVFEPGKPISDDATSRAMFEGFFMINPIFTYSGHDVFVNGDLGVHIAPWTMKGQAPDGSPVEQSGLSIAVLKKQANGEWLMVFDNPHGNYLTHKK